MGCSSQSPCVLAGHSLKASAQDRPVSDQCAQVRGAAGGQPSCLSAPHTVTCPALQHTQGPQVGGAAECQLIQEAHTRSTAGGSRSRKVPTACDLQFPRNKPLRLAGDAALPHPLRSRERRYCSEPTYSQSCDSRPHQDEGRPGQSGRLAHFRMLPREFSDSEGMHLAVVNRLSHHAAAPGYA
jgi:hypothetical protein